jgi:hypothetical protein
MLSCEAAGLTSTVLRGETAGDKSCKNAAEALISETRYQMFLLCSTTDRWVDNEGRFGERS